jgi:hypothetical protein
MKRVLKITAKTSDRFCAELFRDGEEIAFHDGYVPDFMPGHHYGDYVELEIDVDTGQILNWKVPTDKELATQLKGHS